MRRAKRSPSGCVNLDYIQLLSDDELRDFGVYFEDHRYGEMITLLAPGCIVAESGFQRQWLAAGGHARLSPG